MATTNYRRVTIHPCRFNANGNNGLNFAIDATTEKWSAAFIPSESFTLAKVAVYIHSETGTSPAYTWRIETDDGAGRPSGTLAWANATVDVTVTAAGWTALQTLTAAGAVTPGVIYHFVIQESGTPPDASNFVAVRENSMMGGATSWGIAGYLPCYSNRFAAAAWATGSGSPMFVLSNSDSSVMIGNVMDGTNLYTITNTAWKGVKIIAPLTGTLWAVGLGKLNSTSAGAVAAKVISSGNSILATGTVPAGWWDVNTARGEPDLFVLDSPIELTSGQTYRVVWKDPAGQQRFDATQCTSATFKAVKPGLDQYMLTEGTSSDGTASPTSWTDSDDEELDFQLHFNAVSSGGGIDVPVIWRLSP